MRTFDLNLRKCCLEHIICIRVREPIHSLKSRSITVLVCPGLKGTFAVGSPGNIGGREDQSSFSVLGEILKNLSDRWSFLALGMPTLGKELPEFARYTRALGVSRHHRAVTPYDPVRNLRIPEGLERNHASQHLCITSGRSAVECIGRKTHL